MSRVPGTNWRVGAATLARACAVTGCLALATTTALAATAAADDGSTTGATAPVQPPSAKTAAFEAFVREVGIDMAAVPIEVRREWASAPRLMIDDCAIPGTHGGHVHGEDERAEQAVTDPATREREGAKQESPDPEPKGPAIDGQRFENTSSAIWSPSEENVVALPSGDRKN